MEKKEIVALIEELKARAEKDLKDNKKFGVNSYGSGVAYGEASICHELLDAINNN